MDKQKILDSLSPNETKILPYLNEDITRICMKTNLDKTSVLRALEFLKNKEIIEIIYDKRKFIEIGVNGILYRKKELPERKLLNILGEKRILALEDALKLSGLSDDEFKAAIGALKRKNAIELKNKKLILNIDNIEISKKLPEEIFLEALPIDYDSMSNEQGKIFDSLKNRKDIAHVKEDKKISVKVSAFGKEIVESKIKTERMIEQITPELLKKDSWKGKKFRRYDIESKVPEIYGGKRHFVNQAIDYARKIWAEMGFVEMSGNMIESSFWVFDALFTPQDHPAREMQDTFFLSNHESELPDKKIIKSVKESHETGISGSKGWGYSWEEKDARRTVLRTHTTSLSALKLYELSKSKLKKGKFFSVGKVFRNETIDWKHGFEFYQSEGIVVDKDANFRHLLGYLKQFYKKMGFEKIRFRPSYFSYTEPSVEIDVFHPERKEWIELGGAGIFRPEITIPLLGENIPVLAWGQGFDRIIIDYYKIKDLRELYKNNITKLRKIKFWIK